MAFVLLLLVVATLADLPIHCTHGEVMGTWQIELSSNLHDNKEQCGYHHPDQNRYHFNGPQYEFVADATKTLTVKLGAGPTITSLDGTPVGVWTMVYDEGAELNIRNSKFFSFFHYEPKKGIDPTRTDEINDYTSHCNQFRVGWYHGPNNEGYGCFRASQTHDRDGVALAAKFKQTLHDRLSMAVDSSRADKMRQLDLKTSHVVSPFEFNHEKLFEPDYAFIEAVNGDETMSWNAKAHEQFKDKSLNHMRTLVGGRKYKRSLRHDHGHGVDRHTGKLRNSPASSPHSESDLKLIASLPASYDWRNVSGVNYINPVRNQGSCGSCYAIATTAIIEARLRIKYMREKNVDKTFLLSAQDVISCSSQNQGCEGGYPFLVVKYSEEYGILEESCFEYQASDATQCSVSCPAPVRYKTTNYKYVGGYYGGCNEAQMMEELYKNGPLVVAFEAPGELFYYDGGIFTGAHPKSEAQAKGDLVNDWQQTNHAVTAVGWGVDLATNQKYWILKNEWGENWGEGGYFRIKRGTDECGIESMAVTAEVVLDPVPDHAIPQMKR